MHLNLLQKKVLFIAVVAFSLEFYKLTYIPGPLLKMTQFAGVGILLVVNLLFLIYRKDEKPMKGGFHHVLIFMFLGVLLSHFGAYAFHKQGMVQTLTSANLRVIFFYLTYYLLLNIKLPGHEVKKVVMWGAIGFVFFYIIQYALYPRNILNVRISQERGTIRIFLPGFSYAFMFLFLSIDLFYKYRKFFYLAVAGAIYLCTAILSGTRQLLGSVTFVVALYILFSKQIKSRIITISIMLVAAVSMVIIFQDIFLNMLALTEKQTGTAAHADKRSEAVPFFLIKYMPSKWAYVTGNGAYAGSSEYGLQMVYFMEDYGYYLSDIGVLGDLFKFGALYVVGILSIFIKVFTARLTKNIAYIRYFFILIFITMFTGNSPFGNEYEGITLMCIAFYLIDYYKLHEGHQKFGDP